MDLREYEQLKFEIADILRLAATLAPPDSDEWKTRFQALFARLAEDRFNLVVVGRFSRGKTSLMNAILGTDRLPTGIAPLTSVITTVSYGSKDQVILRYDERRLPKEIPIEALPQYITQQGNPGNVQRIKTAEVHLPAEFLRRGFYFVDTPGLGSVIVENTLTTEAFLPEADAFILVTSYESPLSEEELRFFKAASSSGRRIFVALNKQDTVLHDERGALLAFVRDHVSRVFDQSPPQLFSVSAREGLEAKQSGDTSRLAESGIPELEKELIDFLLSEKTTHFLLGMCERARNLILQLPRSETSSDFTKQIGTLAKRIRRKSDDGSARPEVFASPVVPFANLHQLPSCEICAHIAARLWDFLCGYQYDLGMSPEEQQRFASRAGFCSLHAWEYQAIASHYGTCNGFPILFDRCAAELRAAASIELPQEALLAKIQGLLPTRENCALCGIRDKAEMEAVEAVAKRLVEDAKRTLNSLSGICLPHLAVLAASVQDADLTRDLMERQATIFQRLSEDMRRYALKHDAVRRFLASQEETAAAERALMFLVGRRNMHSVEQPTRG